MFIMCDGMGGHDNGEVASKTAATALGEYLMSCTQVDIPTFEAGLQKAYNALDAIDTKSAKKPGTTMTCLCLNEDSYLVAHIGDSRIYHIRPSLYNAETGHGGILYQSSDHSLVNDLLKAGELTEEEARDFPQKNIITRAMQPHLEKRYKADVYLFDDIQSGDYFFICCDGVLEQLSNEDLCRILSEKKSSDAQKLAQIKEVCDGKTRDNYTCWLVPIDKVKIKPNAATSSVIQADTEFSSSEEDVVMVSPTKPEEPQVTEKQTPQNKSIIRAKKAIFSKRTLWLLIAAFVLIAAICCGIYAVKSRHQQGDKLKRELLAPLKKSVSEAPDSTSSTSILPTTFQNKENKENKE